MADQEYRYTLHAILRNEHGKGASRRLRHEGWVPAIIYGGNEAPQNIAIKQDELLKNAKHESFFSQIINLKIEGAEDQEVLVRDVQHHLYKPMFQHFDFQRIVRGQEISATVTLHFINEDTAPGVKGHGGIVSRYLTSLDIVCRPSKLPEYIEVDLGQVDIGQVVHLSDVVLPEGVALAGEWSEEELSETAVAQIVYPQKSHDDDSEDAEAGDNAADDSDED